VQADFNGGFMGVEAFLGAFRKGIGAFVDHLRGPARSGDRDGSAPDDSGDFREICQKYRIVADYTYDWEGLVGPDGCFVYVSPSCSQITGYPAEEFLKNPGLLLEIVHPADRGLVRHHLDEVKKEKRGSCQLEFRILCRDGSTRWIGHVCQSVFDDSGKFLGRRASNRSITKRKQAEQALIESEERLRAVVDNLPVGVWFTDENGVIVYGNSASRKIWSGARYVGPEEFHEYKAWWAGTGKPLAPDDWAIARAVRNGETSLNEVLDIECFDGSKKTILNSAVPFYTPEGGLSGVVVLNEDITESKQAEEELRKSNRRLEILAETAGQLLISGRPQAIINELCRKIMNHLGCQVFFNYLVDEQRGCLQLNAWEGISDETVGGIERLDYGEAVSGCVARDGRRIVAEHISETRDPRTDLVRSLGIEAYAAHPLISQGLVVGTLSFGTRTRPTFTEDELALMRAVADQVAIALERMGSIEELKATRRDLQKSHDILETRVRERTEELWQTVAGLETEIAERRKTEEALWRATAYNRRLIEASPDPLVTIDPDGRISDVNTATENVTGCSRQELIGTDFSDYFTEPEKAREGYRLVFQEGLVRDYALEIRHRDGPVTPVLYNATVYRDEGGNVVGVFAAARDITERLKMEERLRQSNKHLRTLASELLMAEESERRRISVDLHDNVSQSLAVAKLRLDALLDQARECDMIGPIREVRKLIDESIQQTRALMTELSPSVLYELGFEPAVEWLTEQVRTKHGIAVRFESDLRNRRLDQDVQILLFQAVRELLINVVKHAKAIEASISIREFGDHLRIMVRDDGVGFDVSRIDAGVDAEGGFGLFSLRERLQYFGGRLKVTSRSGKGTFVTVEIPRKKKRKMKRRAGHGY
jgi:PAS domain S-box-containing protein